MFLVLTVVAIDTAPFIDHRVSPFHAPRTAFKTDDISITIINDFTFICNMQKLTGFFRSFCAIYTIIVKNRRCRYHLMPQGTAFIPFSRRQNKKTDGKLHSPSVLRSLLILRSITDFAREPRQPCVRRFPVLSPKPARRTHQTGCASRCFR